MLQGLVILAITTEGGMRLDEIEEAMLARAGDARIVNGAAA
jgi:hypothetical protein